MSKQIQRAKQKFVINLISRKALTFFIGVGFDIIFIPVTLINAMPPKDIVLIIGAWTASVSAFASIWCVANHFEKKLR